MQWSKIRIMFTGRLKSMTLGEAKRIVKSLGARVDIVVTKKTDLVVVGARPGTKYAQALALNVRVIHEDAFLDLLAGRPVDLDAARPELPTTPSAPTHASLESLRQHVYGEASRERWALICKALDACDDDTMPVAVDYVDQATAAWPSAFANFATSITAPFQYQTRGSLHYHHAHLSPDHHEPNLELRVMPITWQRALIRGQHSAKFRAARLLGFYKVRLTTTPAREILRSPYLDRLEALYLTSRPLTSRFFKDMAASDALPSLKHLDLTNVRCQGDSIRALNGSRVLSRLEHLSVPSLGLATLRGLRLPESLTSLDVGYNPLGDSAASLLDALDPKARLSALSLAGTRTSKRALERLMVSGVLRELTYLSLSDNSNGKALVEALDPAALPNLKTLNIRFAGYYQHPVHMDHVPNILI